MNKKERKIYNKKYNKKYNRMYANKNKDKIKRYRSEHWNKNRGRSKAVREEEEEYLKKYHSNSFLIIYLTCTLCGDKIKIKLENGEIFYYTYIEKYNDFVFCLNCCQKSTAEFRQQYARRKMERLRRIV